MPELTIAIAKGRLQAEAMELLAKAGMPLSGDSDSRCLARSDETGRSRYIFVKPSDVPVYVEHGIADCGLVGLDILLEYEADVLQPVSLPIGRCQIVIAGPMNKQKNGYAMLKVATKYPHITAKHFGARGQPVEIIQLSGSVELAPGLRLADCIVDLVETGRTLRENGLQVIEVIAESTARLVVNRASYHLKAATINGLIATLKNQTVRA
ncbi:MAG TPA: ATP phosphoribosyltransferase [Pyrinomonadaceae bacterium]|nr:ATP phosphoribosyltransferase [Pyrinomonadaceae bacterium]